MNEQDARTYWASLDEKTKIALVKTAPRVVPPWRHCGDGWTRDNGDCPASFFVEDEPDGDGFFWANVGDVYDGYQSFRSVDEAKAACDAKLRELGYLLEDGK